VALSLRGRDVPRLRISIVEYLNTAPLVWGFSHGPLRGKYDLSYTVPSLCAEALRRGEADIAIIPAIEYQRIPDVVVLPGMAVAAKQEVRSILVLAKHRIEQARRVALDSCSRSSAALVRLLCRKRWRIEPAFFEAPPEPAAMLAEADAALVIGDPALRVAVRMDAGELPVEGVESLGVYDVAYEWRQMTGRPCVLAVWTARRAAATPEVVADFLASMEYGLAQIDEIAAEASGQLSLPAPALARYLRENIDFSLDEENRAGLEWYFRECAEARLIEQARPIEFAAAPGRATAG
jgi:chorismate dehydratase